MHCPKSAIVPALAIALSCGGSQSALAQSSEKPSVAEELADMRAQMAAMAARIEQLESELARSAQKNDAVPATPAAPITGTVETAAVSAPAKSDTDITWGAAPKITGAGGWSFKPRGRLNIDAGFVSSPDGTLRSDGFGSEIRRARLGVEGDIPGGFGYRFEADLAANSVEVVDAFLTYKNGGITITAGQHNSFQGLEELSSSRFTSFIERAAFTDAFGFERRLGISAQYGKGDILLQGGLFADNVGALPNKNWGADGRAVFMPKFGSKSGSTQLHLGGSAHYADLSYITPVRYRQRPAVHFTIERFLDTGNLAALSEVGLGLEAALISGPFHIASEAYWQKVNRPGSLADPTFFGGYVEAGYFLTGGDRRGYGKGVFDRSKPKNPIDKGGIGSWQINLRYDYLDLNDGGIIGGMQNGVQASLIWAPTNYTRFLMTYSLLTYDDAVYPQADGNRSYNVDSLGLRAQIDF